MLRRLLPSGSDFTYKGSRVSLGLLGLVLVMKLAIAVGAIFNGHYAASVADGIPIDSYTPVATQAFLSLFQRSSRGTRSRSAVGVARPAAAFRIAATAKVVW